MEGADNILPPHPQQRAPEIVILGAHGFAACSLITCYAAATVEQTMRVAPTEPESSAGLSRRHSIHAISCRAAPLQTFSIVDELFELLPLPQIRLLLLIRDVVATPPATGIPTHPARADRTRGFHPVAVVEAQRSPIAPTLRDFPPLEVPADRTIHFSSTMRLVSSKSAVFRRYR
jgi:hypothetical protein